MDKREQPQSNPWQHSAADSADPPQAWLDAWRELTPPLPGEDLEREDPGTRAAVNWMRAAWSQVEVPVQPSHRRPQKQLRLERSARLSAILAAAAAAVLWLAFAARPTSPAQPEFVASNHAPNANTSPGDFAVFTAEASISAATSPFGNLQPIAVQDDQLIFQSGSVRLQLIVSSRDPVPSPALPDTAPTAEFPAVKFPAVSSPAVETENQR